MTDDGAFHRDPCTAYVTIELPSPADCVTVYPLAHFPAKSLLESPCCLRPIVWVLTVVICYVFIGHYWWFPPPISPHGLAYDAQFTVTLGVTGIIFFLAQMALG